MQYDYFIASRWRNKEEVIALTQKLRAKNKTVYCFIEGDGSDYALKDLHHTYTPEDFMTHFENLPNWSSDPKVREIFTVDMQALKQSEQVILLLPAGKSAHIEIGVAYGMGKKCILIGQQKEAESLYLIFSAMYPTIDAFLSSVE